MKQSWLVITLLIVTGLTHSARAETPAHTAASDPIEFGLTAVVIQENLRFLDQWSNYLSQKMGQPVTFVRRKSYREVMELLESGSIDFAWICGYPFVKNRTPEYLQLLSVPVYAGQPLYHSYIIVHKASAYQSIEELEGKVFAFSDPESNSGYLYPQFLLSAKGKNPEAYFRNSFFTYNHAETIEAVAEQVADGGAVDSYIWETLLQSRPELVNQTRIIVKSPAFGFPPLVARLGADRHKVEKMKEALLAMSDDPQGQHFLRGLKLDRFGDFPPTIFDSISNMIMQKRWGLARDVTAPNAAQQRSDKR
ncbi:MAG: phosphate/phosphite/phosphonate ABC transporter substrate-binding protein [Motiliproteus sp.]